MHVLPIYPPAPSSSLSRVPRHPSPQLQIITTVLGSPEDADLTSFVDSERALSFMRRNVSVLHNVQQCLSFPSFAVAYVLLVSPLSHPA